jgi:hypothetical protein
VKSRPERVFEILCDLSGRRAFDRRSSSDECLCCTDYDEPASSLDIFLTSLSLGQQLWRGVLSRLAEIRSHEDLIAPWCAGCNAALLTTVGVVLQAVGALNWRLNAGCVGCGAQRSAKGVGGMRPVEYAISGMAMGLVHEHFPPFCASCEKSYRATPDMVSPHLPS